VKVFRHVNIEVLVVDVNLPGISGLELLRNDPHWDEPPVLLMSGQPEQAGIATATRDGLVTAFLAKPFDVEDLVAEVHKAVSTPPSVARPAAGWCGLERALSLRIAPAYGRGLP
jgi:DNA-binding NtrC family response regulator